MDAFSPCNDFFLYLDLQAVAAKFCQHANVVMVGAVFTTLQIKLNVSAPKVLVAQLAP